MAYQYPSSFNYSQGRQMGIADAYDKERFRNLRANTAANEKLNQGVEDSEYLRYLELEGIIVPEAGGVKAGFTIDLTKFKTPGQFLDYLQRTTGLPEYRVYDDKGEFVGFETLELEDLYGKEDDDGNMQYVLGGSDKDGGKVYLDKNRRKGGTKKGEDVAHVNGVTLDILANMGLNWLISRTDQAKDFTAGTMSARWDPTTPFKAKRAEQNLSILARNKKSIERAQEIKAKAGDDKQWFIEQMQAVMDDPALRGTGSIFELIKEAEELWLALGGERQDITPSNHSKPTISPDQQPRAVEAMATPRDTGTKTQYGRTRWQDSTTGEYYSEKSKTFQTRNGMWVNIPSVDADGKIISDEMLQDYINSAENIYDLKDPITGQSLNIFENVKDAEIAAQLKSNSIQGFVEAGNIEGLTHWFSEEGVTQLDDMMAAAQEYLNDKRDLYQMMRLVAATQTDPKEAMLQMERRLISPLGLTSKPADVGLSTLSASDLPAPTKEATEMWADLAGSFITTDNNEDSPTYGQSVLKSGLSGKTKTTEEVKAFIQGQTEEIQRNDPDGTNPNYKGAKSRLLDGIADISVKQMIDSANRPTGERTSVGGWRGGDAIFGSDTWHDRRFIAWWNERPDSPGNTYNPQRDNIRVVVGEDSVLSFMLGAGNQAPRLYVEVGGKESKASMSFWDFMYGGFSGDPETGLDTLKRMVPHADYEKVVAWMKTSQYQEYAATKRVTAPGQVPSSPGYTEGGMMVARDKAYRRPY